MSISFSASSPSAAPLGHKGVLAAVVGNGFELFDFTVFSLLAPVIAAKFFTTAGAEDSLMPLVYTLALFGAGFVARPAGAIILGHLADVRGRRAAMLVSMTAMAVGTLMLALTPQGPPGGMFAALWLLIARLIQGFAVGGEIGSSTSYLLEQAPRGAQARFVSMQMASQGAAALCGALLCFALFTGLSPEQLHGWGWRVPFFLGALVGPVGLYLRRYAPADHPAPGEEALGLRDVLLHRRPAVVRGVGLMLAGTTTLYIWVFFMPSYLSTVLGMGATPSFLSGCTAGAVLAVGAPLAGRWLDRSADQARLVFCALLGSAVLTLPAFALITAFPSLVVLVPIVAVMIGLLSMATSGGLLLILRAFPKGSRAAGLGLVYSAGVTLFGGASQAIAAWLIQETSQPLAVAGYLVACQVISLAVLPSMARLDASRGSG